MISSDSNLLFKNICASEKCLNPQIFYLLGIIWLHYDWVDKLYLYFITQVNFYCLRGQFIIKFK